jgi:phage shock protein PspC (stress-responsive transcriptional regulator)
VRAVWLLCVLLAGGGLLVYLVLWIVMPLDPAYPMLPA